MKTTSIIAFTLVVMGALNWFLVGLFGFDLVATTFGAMSVFSRIIYSIIGLGGLFIIFFIWAFKPFKHLQ